LLPATNQHKTKLDLNFFYTDNINETIGPFYFEIHGNREAVFDFKLVDRFVKQLENDEIAEGSALTLSCKSETTLTGSTRMASPMPDKSHLQRPLFINKLQDQECEEGGSLTLTCKSGQGKRQPPMFVKGECMHNYVIRVYSKPTCMYMLQLISR